MAKRCFERIGNYLRFSQVVDGKERKFEFYHEPFEGELKDNIELFAGMYESGEPGRMQQGVNLLSQSKDQRALPHLIKALRDNKFTGRAVAAAGLANYPGSKKAMKALASAVLYSGDYLLTITAINALGTLKMPAARKPVRKVLAKCLKREDLFRSDDTSGPAAVLTLTCIAALLELGDDQHRPLLLRFLAHPVWEVRFHAARVFAKFPDKNAETLLRKMMADVNPMARLKAAEALIKLGDDSCYGVIEQMLKEREPGVRGAAVATLLGLKTARALDILERLPGGEVDIALKLEVASRLRGDGREAGIEVIRSGLAHEDPFVRQTAIRIAGEMGSERELTLLREAAATEPDEFLKAQIEKKLGN